MTSEVAGYQTWRGWGGWVVEGNWVLGGARPRIRVQTRGAPVRALLESLITDLFTRPPVFTNVHSRAFPIISRRRFVVANISDIFSDLRYYLHKIFLKMYL